MNDKFLVNHLEHLLREINILQSKIESKIESEDCSHLYTTINTLEHRVLEIKKELYDDTKSKKETHHSAWGSTTIRME